MLAVRGTISEHDLEQTLYSCWVDIDMFKQSRIPTLALHKLYSTSKVRDALKAVFPEKAAEIQELVDPGEPLGFNTSVCCLLLFFVVRGGAWFSN